ncbi:HupE/UreJ family protein [Paenibacillus planticolens]|uniref:HupE/UreJ family protein n=1 Tax=Paenibacillus planticolens TaxID=2654976 RepID=A0ABX1ZIC1_9BACL|nr:HupE/UreJ family protein [Paenibacillus planticolens]NOU99821.1 HupE/UreJ family protein [Paenibacillus planticolens]
MFRSKPSLRLALSLLLALFLFALPFKQMVEAHAYSAAYTTLTLTKTQTEMTYALDELSVIELVGGDTNNNHMIEQEEFDAMKDKIEAMVKNSVTLKINDQPKEWTKVESFVLDRKGDATKVILKVLYPPVSETDSISLTDVQYVNDAKTNYVNLLAIVYGPQKSTAALSGKDRSWLMLMTADEYSTFYQDIAQAESAANNHAQPQDAAANSQVSSGWLSFFKLGMHHILSGYDHLLFLFSLLIARQSFKQYATMITAFTVAHSLTLTLTVLGIINVPAYIVEPAIALSICYVALDNMIRKNVSHRWVLTFLFGLIHGMGFADIMKEMVIPKNELAVDLISFNLGIEAVQISIVAILLPLLYYFHRWKLSRRAVIAASGVVLVLGGIWLVERLVA